MVVIEPGLMRREKRYMKQKCGDVFYACRPWLRR
jgi:hypothetical protein